MAVRMFFGGLFRSITNAAVLKTHMRWSGTAFIVNNSTEWYSFSYHLGDDTNRIPNQITPNGTIYQRFMWIQK